MSVQMRVISGLSRRVARPFLGRVSKPKQGRALFRVMARAIYLRPPRFWSEPGHLGGIDGLWCGAGQPRARAADGVLVFVHGGGFCVGAPENRVHIAADLAGRTGQVAFVPRYRLAPEHPFPAGRDDVAAACRAALDMGPVVLAGDSAGGCLALLALARALAEGWPRPRGLVAFSPVTDLRYQFGSIESNAATEAFLPRVKIAPLTADYLAGHDAGDPAASPIGAVYRGAPPVRLLASDTEILRDDAVEMAARIRAQGGDAEAWLWPGCVHAWPNLRGWVPEAAEAIARSAAFINALPRSSK